MIRADLYLVNFGFARSRESARRSIEACLVKIDGKLINKPSEKIDDSFEHNVVFQNSIPYVGRGGLKLEAALDAFKIDPCGKVCIDIGASTGGFTDCMLQNGATKVFSVDVGYGQLAWKLRQDERVVNMERTNIRYVTPEDIDFASIDVSFISLKLVLPVAYNLLGENGELVALIKPQFEAGREQVGKKGVVRDINVHYSVISTVLDFARSINFYVSGLSYSPIKGPEGNIEYLAYLTKQSAEDIYTQEYIKNVVDKSHEVL
mgnify:CR=1 FL=1